LFYAKTSNYIQRENHSINDFTFRFKPGISFLWRISKPQSKKGFGKFNLGILLRNIEAKSNLRLVSLTNLKSFDTAIRALGAGTQKLCLKIVKRGYNLESTQTTGQRLIAFNFTPGYCLHLGAVSAGRRSNYGFTKYLVAFNN